MAPGRVSSMGPVRLNRRRFLGASAAAGLALSQPPGAEAGGVDTGRAVRLGLVGLGQRGTTLLRTALELPGVEVVAVADPEPRATQRARGICQKAGRGAPEAASEAASVLERDDIEAVVVALPCDLHAEAYKAAIGAGKHLYAEKPLGLTLAECDRVIAAAAGHPECVVHVGFQRRSNPRFREAAELIRRGELGEVLSARGHWFSSNGPVEGHGGWLGRRERSGDWMVEQAVHIWDALNWLVGGLPEAAHGQGRRDVFAAIRPERDVTDHYSVLLSWGGGFHATFAQSWAGPAAEAFTGSGLQIVGRDGGLDLASGTVTFRGRGRPRRTLAASGSDTRLALEAFCDAVRGGGPVGPPVSLAEARDATRVGLLVRAAVDAGPGRVVRLSEIEEGPVRPPA